MDIIHGETLTFIASAVDVDGLAVLIGAGWSARCAVSHRNVPVLSSNMAISDGVASVSFDTGEVPWDSCDYKYDIRITDADGNDYWSGVQPLSLSYRIAEAS